MQTDTSGPGERGWGQTSPCLASPAPGPWGRWELWPGTGASLHGGAWCVGPLQ